ncbi:hypothetical protein LDENG_00287660, partial [Lucifuga dentata]
MCISTVSTSTPTTSHASRKHRTPFRQRTEPVNTRRRTGEFSRRASSIEVAPFTAKMQRSSDPGIDRDRERDRESSFPARTPALSNPCPKTSHTHPQVIQSEKSNYFTTLSNSVVNEPPRLYPSKELGCYYEKAGAAGIVSSVGAVVSSPGAPCLSGYGSKSSLSKPPPLIKHQPEGAEGLAGKITEQLSQQHLHHAEQRCAAMSPSSSTAPSSFSSASSHHHHQQPHPQPHPQHQQQQLRGMPSLHRAPVFHPPTQHALERKEAAEREREREKDRERERAGYGGRLSPPTLTPIQPVNLVAAGSKTSAEQQKPPTLLPELREVKGHGIINAATSVASVISGESLTSSSDSWRGGEIIQGRGERGGARGKLHAAMASVIVRPSTCIKYDSSLAVGANKPGAVVHKELQQGRFYLSKAQGDGLRPAEVRESGASWVILPNSNLDDTGVRYKKTSVRGVQDAIGAANANSVCRTAVSPSSGFAVLNKSGLAATEVGYPASARGEVAHKPSQVLSQSSESQDGSGSRTTSPGGSLPPPS